MWSAEKWIGVVKCTRIATGASLPSWVDELIHSERTRRLD